MNKQELKLLLDKDLNPFVQEKNLCEGLKFIDEIILSNVENISAEVCSVYKKFSDMKQEAPEGMKNELFAAIRNFAAEKIEHLIYLDALLLLRFLIVKSELTTNSYYDIARCLVNLGFISPANIFLKLYENKETNLPLKYLTFANFYNLELKDYKTAINYYEKYIKIDETKSVVYTILASLYSKAYGDISLKDQIFYFEKAYKLKPTDRLILHGLAFAYERLGERQASDKYWQELLQNNPTDTDFYNYGAFLISCGDFINGHKYFTHRFNTGDINLEYPADIHKKWDMKTDISDKTLLVHYEQGFGDTFMYCRFVPFLKTLCKKVVFVVQDNLCELIKSSKLISEGIEVIPKSFEIENINYDYSIALLDTPYVLKIKAEDIPYTKGYLEVTPKQVSAYAKKYIKPSGNLKVGISYSGDKSANYNGRDVDICRFNSLFNLGNIDFYLLQAEVQEAPVNVINLGKTFNNFTDTACAIKNMDIVISTDNVILNLSGAMGVKTFGLFNFYTNYRWFKLTGEDVGWYKSVKPFQAEENNRWSIVFAKVANCLKGNL